jgi:four helix bundle protein
LNETENWLYKIRDAHFLDTETTEARIEQTKIISRMLIALIHGIENKPNLSRYDRQL